MPASPPIRVLWHDDELNGPREGYVEVWLNWFDKQGISFGASTRRTSTLREFAAALRGPERFGLLVIDVMLKREPETNFDALGFKQERILRLDAGAQVAGLLRNDEFKARPEWLAAYRQTPVVLLSSTPTVNELLKHYVASDQQDGVVGLLKVTETDRGARSVGADFESRMKQMFESLALSARARG